MGLGYVGPRSAAVVCFPSSPVAHIVEEGHLSSHQAFSNQLHAATRTKTMVACFFCFGGESS